MSAASASTGQWLAAGASIAVALLASACSSQSRSSDQCWNTKVLRLQVGAGIYDIPAEMQPSPDPPSAEGLFYPDYKPASRDTQPELLTCQDKTHVPAQVTSFTLGGSVGTGLPEPLKALSLSKLSRDLPDARYAGDWTIRRSEGAAGDPTYDAVDRAGRRAAIWCQQIIPVRSRQPTVLCRSKVALGSDAELYIAFTGDGLSPKQYLRVIEAAALTIDRLRLRTQS